MARATAMGFSTRSEALTAHIQVPIARALAYDPKVILADEPTGNLDTANSERPFDLLRNLVHERGKALLLATHNPAIAEACDWVP